MKKGLRKEAVGYMVKALTLAAVALMFAGCGGGGGGGGTTPQAASKVSGVAAVGATITGDVYLTYSGCSVPLHYHTGSDGKYSFDVSGLAGPYMLRVDYTVNGSQQSLFSFAGTQGGTANLNPISNLIVANAASGADLAAAFQAQSGFSGIAANLSLASQNVQATLKAVVAGYPSGVADPLTGTYDPTGALDTFIATVPIVVSGSEVTIAGVGTLNVASDFGSFPALGANTISGMVSSANGRSLAGVKVTAARPGASALTTVTDASGFYYFAASVVSATYTVSVSRQVYQPDISQGGSTTWTQVAFDASSKNVTVSSNSNVVANFGANLPTWQVSGQVLDLYGAPMANVAITVTTLDNSGVQVGTLAPITVVTDASGRYTVRSLPSAFYNIGASFSGYDFRVDSPNNAVFELNGADENIPLTGIPKSLETGGTAGAVG